MSTLSVNLFLHFITLRDTMLNDAIFCFRHRAVFVQKKCGKRSVYNVFRTFCVVEISGIEPLTS
jgi:hypothetical protein